MVYGLLAIASIVVGIDDNPLGVLLALFAAIAFVLAFTHPWQTARKFLFLFLASILGFVLFIILNIISDSIVQNPATSSVQNPATSSSLKNLIQSPANDALNLTLSMICTAAFIVGVVGSIAMFIRSRRQTT